MSGDDFCVFRIIGEVVPFVWIFTHVVQFFATIGVLYVAPILAANTVVVMVVRGYGWPLSLGFCIHQLRSQTASVEPIFFRKIEQFV